MLTLETMGPSFDKPVIIWKVVIITSPSCSERPAMSQMNILYTHKENAHKSDTSHVPASCPILAKHILSYTFRMHTPAVRVSGTVFYAPPPSLLGL